LYWERTFSFSPPPVVVAIVVNFLDRDRRFRGDVVWKIVGAFLDIVFVRFPFKTGFPFLVFG